MPFRGGRGNLLARKESVPQPRSPPLGPLLQTLRTEDFIEFHRLDDERLAIKDCEDIASFNWLDKKEPTILIPGESCSFVMNSQSSIRKKAI